MTTPVPAFKNRLAKEKSPYLLQHASNPVDWFAWGPEAFQKAKKENKLIFLSIGYSTCHWCHVMEHESFENPEVADLLNRDFVSIKVDREERPDIDQVYMTAIQAMTGSGGWPLTVFLTPDGKPVTGGTYFPPEDRWGRAGMKTILPRLANLWKQKPQDMIAAGDQMAGILNAKPSRDSSVVLDEKILEKAHDQFSASFDSAYGGFGGAPKFPRSHELSFLLRYGQRSGDTHAQGMVRLTLDFMARGGIYDHLGGGFHRYATDAQWLVPHFEKMLYDQAILAKTYLEAYQETRERFYANVAEDILKYVSRDMSSPESGFYSAEDADSEGEEGKFYVWRPEEIVRTLGPEAGKLFNDFYGVTDQGNFEHGTSILHIAQPLEVFAKLHKRPVEELKKSLDASRQKLFEVREKRIPPHKDDKILSGWNGLVISSFAIAAQVLDRPEYAVSARCAADFVLLHLQKNGRLLRRFRDGESAVPAFQDDYAFFALGLLDLYEATFEIKWLEESIRLTHEMIRLFWDSKDGGFFYTAEDHESLIARVKEYYDGAVPSGNSIAALLLLRLNRMTADPLFEEKAQELMQSHAAGLAEHPTAYPQMLMALDDAIGPSREIVIAGNSHSADFKKMLEVIHGRFEPRHVLIYRSEEKSDKKILDFAPYLKNQKSLNGKVTVYVCQNHVCQLPVTSPDDLRKQLAAKI